MKVVNLYEESFDVYGGRGYNNRHMLNTNVGTKGWLGNPYSMQDYDRDTCIGLFEIDFLHKVNMDEEFRAAILNLNGLRVGCYCKPLKCHLDCVANYIRSYYAG